ncbi:hypothetical protein SESBI_37714 [Sesbania bispinosa]|nr:hypothetical protein SESBI_37714 [Sesbania bispinosa]
METPSDVAMEPKPPDQDPSQGKASSRDKLVGTDRACDSRERVDLIGNNLFRIELEDGILSKFHLRLNQFKKRATPQQGTKASNLDLANIQSNKTNLDQDKESLHGEWMVVTGARKKNSSRNKGKAMPKNIPETVKKTPEQAKAPVDTPGSGKALSQEQIFNSKALPSSSNSNVRKKRLRIEPPDKVVQPSSSHIGPYKPSLKKSSNKAMLEEMHARVPPTYGIQTAWNVDIISANRMRFRGEDDPGIEMGMDTINDPPEKDLTSVSDEDMHEEDRTLKSKVNKSYPPC